MWSYFFSPCSIQCLMSEHTMSSMRALFCVDDYISLVGHKTNKWRENESSSNDRSVELHTLGDATMTVRYADWYLRIKNHTKYDQTLVPVFRSFSFVNNDNKTNRTLISTNKYLFFHFFSSYSSITGNIYVDVCILKTNEEGSLEWRKFVLFLSYLWYVCVCFFVLLVFFFYAWILSINHVNTMCALYR